MYRNLARMIETFGKKHFKFLPTSFILPAEMGRLQEEMAKNPTK
jgi:hypothetical protein